MDKNTFMQVRCGIAASDKKLPFTVTTENVQTYLAKQFGRINNALRTKGVKVTDIEPNVKTIKIGGALLPFFVLLPEEVLDRKTFDPNTPSVFRPDDDSDVVYLKPYYYEVIKRFMYSKEDCHAFRTSQDWRRQCKINNRKNLDVLIKYSTPKVETIGSPDGKKSYVVVILDPLRIFHDMLTDVHNPDQRFNVYIEKVQQLDDNSYDFSISREIVSKKKKSHEADISRLLRMMTQ